MEMYKADPFLLSSLYQSNRPGRMPKMDLPYYLDLQNNNIQWGTQLDMLFIIIVYGVWIRSLQWFGDSLIDFNTATEPGLIDIHKFVLPEAPVIWVYVHVHTAPGFTGSGANQFCTLIKFSEIGAENQYILTFQPYQPHISIYISWRDEYPSSNKMVQLTLGGVLKKKICKKVRQINWR